MTRQLPSVHEFQKSYRLHHQISSTVPTYQLPSYCINMKTAGIVLA